MNFILFQNFNFHQPFFIYFVSLAPIYHLNLYVEGKFYDR